MRQMNFKKEYDERGRESVVIGNKSKKRLDIVPRLICVLLALIIWIYCVNINESDVVTTFTVKFEVVGQNSMGNGLQMYDISQDISEIKVTVQGTNRDINKFTSSDYKAYIDVSKITSAGWSTVEIVTEIPKDSSLKILSVDKDTVSVYADIPTSAVIPLSIKEGNISKPSAASFDYKLEGADEKDGKWYITINGPKGIIEGIIGAEHILEGDFNSSKEISGFPLNFYGADGSLINAGGSNNVSGSMITYDTSKMTIKVDVSTEKTVPVRASHGTPECNHECIPSISNITVVGDPKALESLSEILIQVAETVPGTYDYVLTDDIIGVQGAVLKNGEQKVTVTVKEIENQVIPNDPEQ
ncbi:MAG: hypothetical protein E7667_00490 [Ruminococcaceae bacterium]|nr:hypothetical protein [Oscillospiraceae bacterium]